MCSLEPRITNHRFLTLLALGLLTTCSIKAWPQNLTPSQQKADAAYREGMTLLRAKRYAEALTQFRHVEKDTPGLPQGYTGEGISLALSGKPEAAVAALEKALKLDPNYWVARRELGIIDWQLNRKDQSAGELASLAKLFPDDPSVNIILGQYNFQKGSYAKASEFFSRAPAQLATSPRLSLMQAEARIKMGQLKRAIQELEALSLTPHLDPHQQFRIAWLLGEAKDYSQAIEIFNSLPPDFSDPFGRGYGIALAYYQLGRYADCIKALTSLKSRGELRPELFSLLGTADEKAGHTLQAYDAFRAGVYAFPRDDENYLNIAMLAVQHLNYDVATQVLTAGVQENPGDYKLLLARGVVFSLRKKLLKAQADYEKALALAPISSSYVALAVCFMDQDQYTRAAALLRQAVQKGIRDATVYYFLADALFRQGVTAASPRYQEAMEAVQSGLRLDPAFAYGYLQLGRLELIRDQVTPALADLRRAQALAPDSKAVLYQLAIAYRRAGMRAHADRLFADMTEASQKEAAKFRRGKLMEIMQTVSNGRP
jgi:tetratricopeptide (TPR) repeat protein